MKLTKLFPDTASALAVETLKLPAGSIGLVSPEGLSASLRRAASFMCPTTPDRLVDSVFEATRPLRAEELSRRDVSEALELLIASGDMLELRQESGRSTRLLYLAPPSYIERLPGSYLLSGIRPFGAALIEDDLALNIAYEGSTRILALDPGEAAERLQASGLHEVAWDRWVACPAKEAPADFVNRYRSRLDAAGEAGRLDGLQVLDPTTRVHYYNGRWRAPAPSDTGDFVARRPQAYGAALWCLIRFKSGEAVRVIELPAEDPTVPGWDEARRYQAAIDNLRGVPQQFRVRSGSAVNTDTTFDFFSPLPGFAKRYLQLMGQSLDKGPGSLFSYEVPSAATGDVAAFLTDILWMAQEQGKQ